VTVASWLAEAQPPTARVTSGAGTSAGTSALPVGTSKARAQPIRKTTQKKSVGVCRCRNIAVAITSAASA